MVRDRRASTLRALRPGVLAVFSGALLLGVAWLGPAFAATGAEDAPNSVESALEALETARGDVARFESQLESADTEHAEAAAALQEATTDRDARVAELAAARRLARLLAVNAYVGGGGDDLAALLDAASNGELIWRQGILNGSADAGQRAAQRYLELRQDADEAVLQAADELDARAQRREAAAINVLRSTDAVREAQIWLREAQAREAEIAAEANRPSAPGPAQSGSPPAQVTGGPTEAQWAQLRQCESGGNYRAISASGLYRGAYQFDYGTWQSVGGRGDPAAAPPQEQDARAKMLYASRGSSPWPVCGRYLG